MPTIATGNYPLVQDVHDLVRSMCNDVLVPGGDVYTDTLLLPFTNKAYRRMQKDLAARGVSTMRDHQIITLSAGGTELNDDGNAPNAVLPSDFLHPIFLKERAAYQTTDQWAEMVKPPSNMLPTVAQDGILRFWTYEANAIRFVGSTADRDIWLEYEKALPVLTNTTNPGPPIILSDPLRIRGSLDAIANYAAAWAVRSRGNAQGYADYMTQYAAELALWLSEHFKQYMRSPVRRRGYGARRRVY